MKYWSMFLKLITFMLPWRLRRRALQSWFGYKIHPKAHIGFAWVFPRKLIMSADCKIDHFTVAIHIDKIEMGAKATIGRGNWITGFPTNTKSLHFKHQVERQAELLLEESADITKGHHWDCTDLIKIGRFTTIAGYNSQFLTHSVDLVEGRQNSQPIYIGEYSFVGTNVVVLGGSILPSFSVLGAKSLLNKTYSEEWTIYAGTPAKPMKKISRDAKYFNRTNGYVY
jgi:acetyltransferase-like isoleucine patch superfamily enzyme